MFGNRHLLVFVFAENEPRTCSGTMTASVVKATTIRSSSTCATSSPRNAFLKFAALLYYSLSGFRRLSSAALIFRGRPNFGAHGLKGLTLSAVTLVDALFGDLSDLFAVESAYFGAVANSSAAFEHEPVVLAVCTVSSFTSSAHSASGSAA